MLGGLGPNVPIRSTPVVPACVEATRGTRALEVESGLVA